MFELTMGILSVISLVSLEVVSTFFLDVMSEYFGTSRTSSYVRPILRPFCSSICTDYLYVSMLIGVCLRNCHEHVNSPGMGFEPMRPQRATGSQGPRISPLCLRA